ncbi:MAG: 23S rRNA (pseudouridine(1915)-N(3))-methyltransferase RlmH [Saprospiraceae bacterium]|nr:23S rRNA (pseudouridine(1915)-N(3))-methyltransferase RlmH [Saprospiraceae bacterium]
MELEVWWIGKTKDIYLQDGISVYQKKLAHYASTTFREFKEAKGLKSIDSIRQFEEPALLKALQTPGILPVLLDEIGTQYTSGDFATWLQKQSITHNRKVCFIIGSSYGFSSTIRKLVPNKLSLSKMTYTHQMTRLIFLEQLFRAFTIINKIPYHNE